MTTVTARLLVVEPLNPSVRQLLLDTPGFTFSAGQYLYVHAGPRRVPLSIASAPARLPTLELHYRSTPDDDDAAALDELLPHARALTLDGPHGNVVVTGPTPAPLTLIAGGTGIAQAISIVEQLSADRGQREPVQVWWSLTSEAASYPVGAIQQLDGESWFALETLYDDPAADANAALARIRRGHVHAGQYILCGSPGFVYSCADELLDRGVTRASLRSDVFDYAPRSDWDVPS